MKKFPIKINKSQFLKLHNAACGSYKNLLMVKYGSQLLQEEYCKIEEFFYNKLDNAISNNLQRKVFNEVFGVVEEYYNVGDNFTDGNGLEVILMRDNDLQKGLRLVDIDNSTIWAIDIPVDKEGKISKRIFNTLFEDLKKI